MKKILLIMMFIVPIVQAKEVTFANNDAKRQQSVKTLRKKAVMEKAFAVEWAKKSGVPVTIDNGFQKMELMRFENNKPIYYSTFNVDAAISAATDKVRCFSPFNVAGSNTVVGIWDGGSVLQTHQEFTDNRVVLKNVAASHYHATHVGGTIGAAGIYASSKGMAPSVTIHSYDWTYDLAEMTAVAASYPAESNTIYLSNHSYGYVCGWNYNGVWSWYGAYTDGSFGPEYGFGMYMSTTRAYDNLVYNAPYYLPFKASGNDRNDGPPSEGTSFLYWDGSWKTNSSYSSASDPAGDGQYKDGYDTIGYVGNAKNILTVGAVNPAVSSDERSLASATMSSFSSWGPADDGRIKPDVVADGVGLLSTYNTADNAYAIMSGTSMATPNACGSAALLIELYENYFSTNNAMRASTLKGLIIHTADDLGRPGPDYINGWGLVNIKNAADILKSLDEGDNIRVDEAMLNTSTDQSKIYTFNSDGKQPIKVTLCWTDPPGTATSANDSRTPVLINDLDLKVINGASTNYPYSLSYTYPSSNATAIAENNIDNVEQVYIASPSQDDYTIVVDYDGTLTDSEQWFSLIVSGNVKPGTMLLYH
jgi:hypothetical protein